MVSAISNCIAWKFNGKLIRSGKSEATLSVSEKSLITEQGEQSEKVTHKKIMAENR